MKKVCEFGASHDILYWYCRKSVSKAEASEVGFSLTSTDSISLHYDQTSGGNDDVGMFYQTCMLLNLIICNLAGNVIL